MELLQKAFVFFLNPIYNILIFRIPIKIRYLIIGVCFSMIFVFQVFHASHFSIWYLKGQTFLAIEGCVLLFIVILMSINGKLEILNLNNKLFCYLWMICGLIIIAVSFIHPVGDGYRALACTMILAFPCLWFIWANRGDYKKLFEIFSASITNVGCIYLLICFYLVPLSSATEHAGRYTGTTSNPNLLAFFCTAILICSLYLLLCKTKHLWIYIAIAGLANLFTLYTVSRTSLLCNIIAIMIFCIFYYKVKIRKKHRIKEYITIIITLVIIGTTFYLAIVTTSTSFATGIIRDCDGLNSRVEYVVAESVDSENADQIKTSVNLNRITNMNRDLNTLSSGRITLWSEYISRLNLLGNNGNEFIYLDGRKIYGAHNAPLEIAFRSGIVNGIIFFIIEIITVMTALKYVFRKRNIKCVHIFSTMCIGAYFIYSLLELVTLPFKTLPVLLYFIAIGPLFFKPPAGKSCVDD